MMDRKEQLHIKQLLNTHQRRLRILELKQAQQGINTPAELLMELEDLRNEIDRCHSQLKSLDGQNNPSKDKKSPPKVGRRHLRDLISNSKHIEITLDGDFDDITPEIQLAFVRAIAAILEIPPDKVEVLRVMRGSVIFIIKLPQSAAETLMKIYNSNDELIEELGIEKIRVIEASLPDFLQNAIVSETSRLSSHPALEGKDRVVFGTDRVVFRRGDGVWVNKRNDSNKASSLHNTQEDAEDAARKMLENQGGGELTIKAADGRIRSKDIIKPSTDPNPPKDKEH